jgi:hypothetical protein
MGEGRWKSEDGSGKMEDGSGKMEDGSNCVKGMDSRRTLND